MLEGGIAGGRELRAVREGKEGAREGGRNQEPAAANTL